MSTVSVPFRRRQQPTVVWVLLMAATVTTTWLLSKDAVGATTGTGATFALVGWKVRLIILDFMELRHAPWQLRLVFEAWSAIVPAIIFGFYLAT